jgi:hypothetical protein
MSCEHPPPRLITVDAVCVEYSTLYGSLKASCAAILDSHDMSVSCLVACSGHNVYRKTRLFALVASRSWAIAADEPHRPCGADVSRGSVMLVGEVAGKLARPNVSRIATNLAAQHCSPLFRL